MSFETFETYESEVRSYCRKFKTIIQKAKGSKIWDEEGKEYIDFFDGAGALNYGHNNDYIKERVIDYFESDGIVHALDMYTGPKRDFIEYFETKMLQPRGYDYKIMFTGPTGTNAVEAALKLARKVTGRANVFAMSGCFHGMTLGALALTTDAASRKGAGVPLNNVTHIPAPYDYPQLDTIAYMQNLLDSDHSGIEKPAAVVIETVQAEGGVHPFDVDWLKGVREFCTKNDILMIVDDIQVGCGRTGTFFSFERADIVPDIVVMSKSIGGYGLPMAICLFRPELDIWKPGEHNGTFRGIQPAFVAAKAALEFGLSTHLYESVTGKGEFVRSYLEKEILPLDGKLSYRGIGLIWGIDFEQAAPKGTARKVVDECFKNGLIIELAGKDDCVLKIMPALTITEKELKQGLDIIKNAIQTVLGQ